MPLYHTKAIKWVIKILQADNNKNWGALAKKYVGCLDKDCPSKMFSLRINKM